MYCPNCKAEIPLTDAMAHQVRVDQLDRCGRLAEALADCFELVSVRMVDGCRDKVELLAYSSSHRGGLFP